MQVEIIAIAAAVLAIAAFLLTRELRSAALARSKVKKSSRPPPVALVSVAPEPMVEAEDVTLIGAVAKNGAPKIRKPLVSLADDGEDEPSSRSEAVTLFEERADLDEPTNPSELFFVAAVAQTDKGQRRRRNEDSYLLSEEHDLFMVADGMGGYAGGDVASQLAIDTVGKAFNSDRFPVQSVDSNRPVPGLQLVSAIESAHKAVVAHAHANPEYEGMGTTIVGARFLKKKRRVYIAYVGDSRCYRLRNGTLKQLTVDHTLEARGVPAPMGSAIRRAVGVGRRVKVDLLVDVPQPEDVYLLCSDGLNKMVSDEKICATMLSTMTNSSDMQLVARELVQSANAAGGKDNITALVAQVRSTKAVVGRAS
ncbi:MAG: serine/threonine-protein phosphatase [Proteobacteria bacterium]|nr:MAG: serine/threonine-protein phosphatase [Pseudomonadota bacterium]